jgi:hypothetical protein
MYEVKCAIPGTRYFSRFETLSAEQAREALHEAWTTTEQRKYNAEHTTCEACRGRGYKTFRGKNGQLVREAMGCSTCLGVGAVPKLWPARA